jgi:hypothetical protein
MEKEWPPPNMPVGTLAKEMPIEDASGAGTGKEVSASTSLTKGINGLWLTLRDHTNLKSKALPSGYLPPILPMVAIAGR